MTFVLLAFSMFACGEKKLTNEDMKEAEKTLFNEDMSMNTEAAPKVVEKYCQFVAQNPEDPTADLWLFHAMEISVMLKDAEKSESLCDKLLKQYPQSKWAPNALMLLGSYVYNDQVNDTARAHQALQRLIDEYPESELVDDAQKSIEFLGLSPDEIMGRLMMDSFIEGGADFE